MYAQRPESFLPTIKCSTCGVDIDMSALAEHICSESAGSPSHGYGNSFLSRLASRQAPTPAALLPTSQGPKGLRSRAPPQIDAGAANQAYLDPAHATQNQYGSAYRLPHTPSDGVASPMKHNDPYSRSVRNAPPSPPMSLGYDNPFPPWPSTPAADSTHSASPLRDREPHTPNPPRNPRLEGLPPTQPLKSPVHSVMRRMDTITRGPFDARRQVPKAETQIPAYSAGHRRNKTSESAKSFRSRSSSYAANRPSTAHSKKSQTSMYSETSDNNRYTNHSAYEDQPPVPDLPKFSVAESSRVVDPVQEIDAMLGSFSKEESARPPPLRSHTYPEDRQPTLPNISLPESSHDDLSHDRLQNNFSAAPTTSSRLPALQTQFPGIASAHSPTGSASSNGSVFSSTSSHSSRSSPPDSEADAWSRRPSDASVKTTYTGLDGRIAPRVPQTDPVAPMPHTRQRSRTTNVLTPLRTPSRDLETEAKLSSPIDPAIQHGIFGSGRRPSAPHIVRAPITQSPPHPSIQRNATTASRPTCRGCTTPIMGKAIKASDGRITGRWHRDCFVCLTCKAPFPTGDFYVLNDQPYCERHYHSLNGSLCGACDGGIEGQYLETDQGKKYHKLCFTCDACDIPLRDEYYEVGGKQYCERHAWAVAQRNAGLDPSGRGFRGGFGAGARLEKRSTRMMMM